jgi:hypothetical protein
MNISVKIATNPIDQMGMIKAQIANLELQEAELRQQIIDMGVPAASGELFDVTVVTSVRESHDSVLKGLISDVTKKYLKGLTRQFITAHTVEKEVVTVKVTARK